MAGFQFVSTQGTTVKTPEAGKADNLEVGDESKLPKPDSEPADLNLFDDTVKKPVVTPSEDAVFNDTAIAIATAADDLDVTFEGAERVAYAMEALRQVPVSHLNPSVIAMFETHLPRGTRRVARESAMTPVNMRRIALEQSGQGFFASVREAIRKIWEWIKNRIEDFLDLFKSNDTKIAEADKKIDKIMAEGLKELEKLPVVPDDEPPTQRSGKIVNKDGQVGFVVQPTEATKIFFKGFSAQGIVDTAKVLIASLDKANPVVNQMARFLTNAERFEKRVGAEAASAQGEKLSAKLLGTLATGDDDMKVCSVHEWPKQYVVLIDEDAGPMPSTVPVEFTGNQEAIVLTQRDTAEISKVISELAKKSQQFMEKSEQVIFAMEKQMMADVDKASKLAESDPAAAEQFAAFKAAAPTVIRCLAHVMAGATFHANLVCVAWSNIMISVVKQSEGKIATENAKPAKRPAKGFMIV